MPTYPHSYTEQTGQLHRPSITNYFIIFPPLSVLSNRRYSKQFFHCLLILLYVLRCEYFNILRALAKFKPFEDGEILSETCQVIEYFIKVL